VKERTVVRYAAEEGRGRARPRVRVRETAEFKYSELLYVKGV
jgi:hypothetical protein